MTIELSVQNIALALIVLGVLIPLLVSMKHIRKGIIHGFKDFVFITRRHWLFQTNFICALVVTSMIHPLIHGHWLLFNCRVFPADMFICLIAICWIGLSIAEGYVQRKKLPYDSNTDYNV